jgi:hypothetical protein
MNRNKYTKHSKTKIDTLKRLREIRDQLVDRLPEGKDKKALQAKARLRTDLDEWNAVKRTCTQMRLL